MDRAGEDAMGLAPGNHAEGDMKSDSTEGGVAVTGAWSLVGDQNAGNGIAPELCVGPCCYDDCGRCVCGRKPKVPTAL